MNSRYSVIAEQVASQVGAKPFTEYQIFDDSLGIVCGVMYSKDQAEIAVKALNEAKKA